MSIDRKVYVGPIARCRFASENFAERIGSRCPRDAKHLVPRVRFDWPKFCPECGAMAVAEVLSQRRTKVDPLSNLNTPHFSLVVLGDGFGTWPKNEHVYGSNLIHEGSGAPRRYDLDDAPSYFATLDAVSISMDLRWFETRFKRDIERLRERYGIDAVKIDWAVMRWSS